MTRFNPDMQIQFCRDVDRVFFGKAPSISVLTQAYGRNTAETWLICQLNDLSLFAGCKEKLTARQINETAAMIAETYPHYKLTEFMLFFQRFKRCQYGKFYGAVDPMVILQALSTFSDERAKFINQRRQAEQDQRQKELDEEEHVALRRRYRQRVPDAFTDKAPINFLQYRLMGYDYYSDEDLRAECEAISSGQKKIPVGAQQMLESLKCVFGIKN